MIENNFEELCREGVINRYGQSPDTAVIKRLEYEIKVIQDKGYTDIFLILWDAVRYAKANNIPVGPGCGCMPGSLCAYCIGITDIDPIKYNLLFERFINPEADIPPCFDIDVGYYSQHKMADYLIQKHGTREINIIGRHCLSEIAETERIIQKEKPDFSIANIPQNVPDVYQMLSCGDIDGVAMTEYNLPEWNPPNIKQILKDLQPDCFEHLIALTAMYRPDTIKSIPAYIANRHHPERVKYSSVELKSILDVTYGGIVYQEQLMQIFEKMAGYSLSRADIVRRALAKKTHYDVSCERNIFIYGMTEIQETVTADGCLCRGIGETTANAIFDRMVSVAPYTFCKAHAAAYALLTYRTAYLKCFYPEAWNEVIAKKR